MIENANRDDRSAVDKAICIMKAVGAATDAGLGVSELARRVGLSKSTVFRLLAELERGGMVEKIGTSYRPGGVLDGLGRTRVEPEHEIIREAVTPFLADLYESTHLTVQLAVLRGADVIYLNKLEGHQRLRTPSRIGARMPAYCTAVGKVSLANDALAADAALAQARRGFTNRTITADVDLIAELDAVREAGVALDRGEALDTLSCIAAPVRGAGGRVVAAISVSGDSSTFQPGRWDRAIRQVAHNASRVTATALQRTAEHARLAA